MLLLCFYLNVWISLTCSALLVLITLMWGATANDFYCYLNVWIAMTHATLIGFDYFDMGGY